MKAWTRSAGIASERFQSHTGCTWYTPWNWTRSTLQGNYLLSEANLLLPGVPAAKQPEGLRGDPPAEAERQNKSFVPPLRKQGRDKNRFREQLIASYLPFCLGVISPKRFSKGLDVRWLGWVWGGWDSWRGAVSRRLPKQTVRVCERPERSARCFP